MLALPVTYSAIFDAERAESLKEGKPLELKCQVADSTVPVCWYKKDKKLCPPEGGDIRKNGASVIHIIPSAELFQPELHSCETSDEKTYFSETIKGEIFIQTV